MKFDHLLTETKKIPCKKCNFVFQSVLDIDKSLSGHENNQVKKSIIECEERDDDDDDDDGDDDDEDDDDEDEDDDDGDSNKTS